MKPNTPRLVLLDQVNYHVFLQCLTIQKRIHIFQRLGDPFLVVPNGKPGAWDFVLIVLHLNFTNRRSRCFEPCSKCCRKLAGVGRLESREAESFGNLNQRRRPQPDFVIGSDKAASKIISLNIANNGVSLAPENKHFDRQSVIEDRLKILNADLKATILAETNHRFAVSGHTGADSPRQGKARQFKARGANKSLARLESESQQGVDQGRAAVGYNNIIFAQFGGGNTQERERIDQSIFGWIRRERWAGIGIRGKSETPSSTA